MADTSKAKFFEFTRMISNWNGYVSAVDRTNVAENILVQGSQNVYKKLSGTIAVRQGQKRQGVANSTVSPISSEFVWNTSWGQNYTMVISNANLYVVINKVWYSLLSSLTKTRYVFDSWWDNTLKKDDCLFVNGTANIYKWGGGFGLISTTTVNTIVLDRTIVVSQFPTALGTVVVNGTTYTYTGSSGSTLTGITVDPTGEANGSGVLETVTTSASKPVAGFLNDFIKVVNNQLYVGSYTSQLCYISSNTDYTNYTIPTPRVTGSPELIVLDGTGRGIGVRQGNACLGYGANGWAVISFADITVGTTLTNVTTRTLKPVALLQAPYAHEFIDNVNDNLIYLGQDQQVHEFGDFNTAFVPVYPSLSQEIANELKKEIFTGGGLKCIGEFIYITAPNSGKTYLRQERTRVDSNGTVVAERLWHSPFIWNATFIDQIGGVVVAFSNANPQIYEVWDTNQWYDDSPSDEPLPYSCVMALGYRGEQRRQGLWSFNKQFTEGYITPGTPLNLLMNYDYQGKTNVIGSIINSIAQPAYLFNQSLASLGDNSLGDESLGNGGITETGNDQDSLAKFKVINTLPIINCFEWQPIFYSDAVNAQWEILATGSNAEIEQEQVATFIINKKRV
jgi:hypothetical protein